MEKQSASTGEIIVYKPSEQVKLDVRVEKESVWLSLSQLSMLFCRDKSVISRHISNIFSEGEQERTSTVAKYATVQIENGRSIIRQIEYYNLDIIISVGYRVKSLAGVRFRKWANEILKQYLLCGYSINQRFIQLESQVKQHQEILQNHSEKIDFFVQTSLPPVQGIFYNGQIFDAYKFANDLIRSANIRIILIDNYIDDTVLTMFDKRKEQVKATIYTAQISKQLQLDIAKHNEQYRPIDVQIFRQSHDRFLIVDDVVYLIGASLKDLGKKMFAFSKLEICAGEFINQLQISQGEKS